MGREQDGKRGSFFRGAINGNGAGVSFYYTVDNSQTDACTFANSLGGEIGFKYFI